MVNLRAQLSGLYDLSVIKLRHIRRAGNFADVLARLSAQEVFDEFNELACDPGYAQYVFPLTDVLRCDREGNEEDSLSSPSQANATFASVDQAPPRHLPVDVPVGAEEELGAVSPMTAPATNVYPFMAHSDADGFPLEAFSDKERLDMQRSKLYSCRSGMPVTRKLHGRTLFCVPSSKIDQVWLDNHVALDGYHHTLADTRLATSHLHWSGKLSDLRLRFGACECQEADGPKGLAPIQVYQGQAARPGVYGETVFFDQKSFPTAHGRQYLGTSLDKTSGLFNAIPIAGPTGEEAIRQIKTFLASGRSIGAAVFDRHASYLRDKKFRAFLDELNITPYYSKGEDPKFISDLERCHRELNRLVRTLPDPWEWQPSLLDFLYTINNAPMESFAGSSRGGMAFGHSPVEAWAIATRHKSFALATRDSRQVEAPAFQAGDNVLLNQKFRSQVEEARRIVRVLLIDGAKSLVQYRDENPKWMANVHILPLPNKAGVNAAALPAEDDLAAEAPDDPGADLPDLSMPIGPRRRLPVGLPVVAGRVSGAVPEPRSPVNAGPVDLDAKYAEKRDSPKQVRFHLPNDEIVVPGDSKLQKLLSRLRDRRNKGKAPSSVEDSSPPVALPLDVPRGRPNTPPVAIRAIRPVVILPAGEPAGEPDGGVPLVVPNNRVSGAVARAQKRARSAKPLPPVVRDDAVEPRSDADLPVDLPDEKRSEPQVGDWCVASDGLEPWFGVITSIMKDSQLMVHHFRFRETKRGPPGRALPVWINDAGRTRSQQYCPSNFDPAVYIITVDNIVVTAARKEKEFNVPLPCMKALADYARTV